jgi:hypothetical protein
VEIRQCEAVGLIVAAVEGLTEVVEAGAQRGLGGEEGFDCGGDCLPLTPALSRGERGELSNAC